MSCSIGHFHRQIAAAAIKEQRTGLKRRAFATVEAGEGDKVIEQRQQIALQANQLFQRHGLQAVLFFSVVMVEQLRQRILQTAAQQLLNLDFAQGAQRRGRALGQPVLAMRQHGFELIPLLFGQHHQGIAKDRLNRLLAQGLQRRSPCGIDAMHQRQVALAGDRRQRQCGQRFRGVAQHLRT